MSWFVMAVGVLVVWRTIAWLWSLAKTGGPVDPPLRRRPRRHWHPGDTIRRRAAAKRARQLIAVLANGLSHDPVADLADGLILGAGEVAIQRSTTHFSVWVTRSTWLSHSRVRWGRHVESGTSEVRISRLARPWCGQLASHLGSVVRTSK